MKKILLIEDNPEMRENTAEILELSNYHVIATENGRKGIEEAKEHHPDLIICDIMMPELDGYGVLHVLSKNPDTQHIPFIFLSAKAERSDIRKGMDLGADDYLTKPFDEAELLNAVESRLRKQELFFKEFQSGFEGLDEFWNEARQFEELKNLSSLAKQRSYRKKEVLYAAGDPVLYLVFINKGTVKTTKLNPHGKELITGLHSANTFIGHLDILNHAAERGESAIAIEPVEATFIPKEDFMMILNSNRSISHRFIRMLSNNIRENEERMLGLAFGSVRAKVAEALLTLGKQNSVKGGPHSLQLQREDLAGIVGMAVETLIRTLAEFKEENLISTRGSEIVILNNHGLEQVKKLH